MMQRELNDTANTGRRRRAEAASLFRRPRVLVRHRHARSPVSTNVIASFGVIAGLLMFWAMTVNM